MKNVLVITSVLLASALSHAQTSTDATSEFYNRFTGMMKDGTPNTSIGTNFIKFKGVSSRGDSCELKIDEYRAKGDNGGELVVYSLDVFHYATGEVSHYNYEGNMDSPVDSQRSYDLTTGMDVALKVGDNGKVTKIVTPAAALAAGYYAYGEINSWNATKQNSKLVINQAAKRNYWGNRNIELTFSPDGSSIASARIVSLSTKGSFTCNSLALVPQDKNLVAKVKADKLAEEIENAKPVACNSSCSPCTHVKGSGSDNINLKAQVFSVSSRNFMNQLGPSVIGQCDAKKLYDEYPGMKLNYNNSDAVCTSMGDCSHVKIVQVGDNELYCRQTTLVSDKTKPTFWSCVVYNKKTNSRIKDSSSLKEALGTLNIKLDE